MSDTVVVMNNGEIQQIGSPTDIYNEPENRFVAGFIGESNIIEGTMIKDFWWNLMVSGLNVWIKDLRTTKPLRLFSARRI